MLIPAKSGKALEHRHFQRSSSPCSRQAIAGDLLDVGRPREPCLVRARYRLDERLGVPVLRAIQYLAALALSDALRRAQDVEALGDLPDNGQIVGDEQISDAYLSPDRAQEIE